jgi:pentapeptide repeat protein
VRCPTCGQGIDPVRAPVAKISGGRVVTYCSADCANGIAPAPLPPAPVSIALAAPVSVALAAPGKDEPDLTPPQALVDQGAGTPRGQELPVADPLVRQSGRRRVVAIAALAAVAAAVAAFATSRRSGDRAAMSETHGMSPPTPEVAGGSAAGRSAAGPAGEPRGPALGTREAAGAPAAREPVSGSAPGARASAPGARAPAEPAAAGEGSGPQARRGSLSQAHGIDPPTQAAVAGRSGDAADARGADARGANARGADARGADAQGADARGADARGADAQGRVSIDRGHLLAEARAALDTALSDPSPRIRELSAMALARTAPGAAVLAELTTALERDTSEIRRLELAHALALAGEGRGTDTLVTALRSPRRDVRLEAARLLALLGDARGKDRLREALDANQLRLSAAENLAGLGDARGIGILKEALAGKNPENRLRAAVALGRAGDASGLALLKGVVAESRLEIGAEDALARLGDQSCVPALGRALGLSALRVQAAIDLRRLGAAVVEGADLMPLANALAAADPYGKVTAAEAVLVLLLPQPPPEARR